MISIAAKYLIIALFAFLTGADIANRNPAGAVMNFGLTVLYIGLYILAK